MSCYRVETVKGEKRQYFAFPYSIAPVKVSVLPLLKNKPELVALSQKIYHSLLGKYNVEYDSSGAIGRRYRRADEAGTPFCVTVDFDSLEKGVVTVRQRDTMEQDTVYISDLGTYFSNVFHQSAE